MEIKLNREEILCLIRKMGGVAIRLRNTSIHAVVTNQKYVNLLTELNIDDLKYVAGNYIRSIANLFDYEGVIEYDFAFDSIIIAAKATILKNSYIESAVIDEADTFIDDRWVENNDNYDDNYAKEYNEEYDDTYDDYHCDDDYPHSEYDEIDKEIDKEEEQERRELEDLETYEEQVRESDEINYKIQAEMEQYMFENGKDYEDYQEPQLYDTEDDLVDSLNNDLDDCLSKE